MAVLYRLTGLCLWHMWEYYFQFQWLYTKHLRFLRVFWSPDLFSDAMLTSWGNSLQYWQSYSAKFSIVVYKLTTILNYLIYAIADKFITWAYGPAQAHPPRDWMPKRSFNNDDTKLWCRNKPLSRCRIKNEKTGRRDVFKFPRTIKFLLLENTSLASLKWNTMLLISTI